ncbi:histidine protein methyltransferase 1 homolog isoform X2 [Acanthaster planci]|uniref:protein-histidine N-methyltransferase n=1 Tax=Acanthaster planci TaxID=133434 RepID=A0A8B7YU04_ACAPL|nr:histidine protein methyltransferase 1 homolog isoform X2 [Acanthaster planci]
MAFQFNFDIGLQEQDNCDDDHVVGSSSGPSKDDSSKTKDILRPAKELYAPPTLTTTESCAVETLKIGNLELHFLNPEAVEFDRLLGSIEYGSDISKAAESHSDLIPNVYEGGLKVWECSIDLVHYLHEAELPLENKDILELGCGAGLPGIYALKRAAAAVHFQDYNEEVIEHMTIPNVALNQSDKAPTSQDLRFFSGDWSLVQEKIVSAHPDAKYDVILTSETIYSLESHDKLYKILRALLRRDGVVYIAAKTHYFGVGGGTRSFQDVVRQREEFSIQVCKTFTDGVKREILKMAFLETS